MLRDSCTSSTSNSQYSLTGLASCPSPAAAPPPQPPSRVSAIPAPASTPASLFSLLPVRGPDAPLGPPGAPSGASRGSPRRSAALAPPPRSFLQTFGDSALMSLFQDEEPFPLLVPVNGRNFLPGLLSKALLVRPLVAGPEVTLLAGEESLRRCFHYFEELDVDYHRKFFRRLNINDNVIKGKEELPFEDRLHELLHIWMEKEGRGASLNRLLEVLLDLNQRRTAENIKEQALHQGHYLCEG